MVKKQNQVPMARANIIRGCGIARIAGGVYLESGLSEHGTVPIESLFIDPAAPKNTSQKIGVDFVKDTKGVTHVIDWVGEEHYPYPSDFLEEARLHGISRKISKTERFQELSKDSQILFLHARAVVENAAEIYPHLPEHRIKHYCGKFHRTGDEEHFHDPEVSCTRLWYALAPATDTRVAADGSLLPERRVSDDTRYVVEPLPFECPEPIYKPGVIARAPITNISVIEADNGSHKVTLDRITQAVSGLPVLQRPQ